MSRYDYRSVKIQDNRDKEGLWIRDGARLAITYQWVCPYCHARDQKPEPYCHGCGARLRREE